MLEKTLYIVFCPPQQVASHTCDSVLHIDPKRSSFQWSMAFSNKFPAPKPQHFHHWTSIILEAPGFDVFFFQGIEALQKKGDWHYTLENSHLEPKSHGGGWFKVDFPDFQGLFPPKIATSHTFSKASHVWYLFVQFWG